MHGCRGLLDEILPEPQCGVGDAEDRAMARQAGHIAPPPAPRNLPHPPEVDEEAVAEEAGHRPRNGVDQNKPQAPRPMGLARTLAQMSAAMPWFSSVTLPMARAVFLVSPW